MAADDHSSLGLFSNLRHKLAAWLAPEDFPRKATPTDPSIAPIATPPPSDYLHLLNETAFKLVDMTTEDEIYTFLGETLLTLLNEQAIVVVSKIVPDDDSITIHSAYGVHTADLERIFKLLGYSAFGKSVYAEPITDPEYMQGKLIFYEGRAAELASQGFPEAFVKQVFRILNAQDVYIIGLHKGNKVYARIHIYPRGDTRIESPAIIEAIVQQASTALQRLQALESLAASEVRYQSLFHQSNDAVLILNLDGTAQHMNQRAVEMLGYDVVDIAALPFQDMIIPEEQGAFIDIIARLLTGETVPPFERTFRHKDGHWVYTEVNMEIVRNADGEPLYIQSIMRDIAARKSMENLLRDSENRYRQFFEHNRAIKLVIDPKTGAIIDANAAASEYYGYTRAELLSMKIHDINILTEAEVKAEMEAARREQRTVFHFQHQLSNGEIRDVEVFSGPIEVNGEQQLFSIILDITTRKKAQAALKASETRLQSTIRGTRAGTWEWNVQTGATVFNERWAEIVGYTLDELSPLSIQTWQDLTHPDDLAHSMQMLQAHFAGERDYYHFEARMRHKAGHWVWVADRGKVMTWTDDGQPLLMYGTHVDITERKRIEQQLRQNEAYLRSLVDSESAFVIRICDGKYSYANAAYLKWMGYDHDELIGMTAYDTIDPADHEKSTQTAIAVLTTPGTSKRVFLTKIRADGSQRRTLWEYIALSDNNDTVTEFQCMGFDVTEQYEMEQALRLSEERFAYSATIARLAWWELDIQTGNAVIDEQMYAIAGYAPQDFNEINIKTIADIIHPDDYALMEASLGHFLTGTRSTFNHDKRLRKADGSWMWLHVHGKMITLENGSRLVRGYAHDITERKAAQTREIEFQLERRRHQLLASFFQNAAHEFRTPLATISTSSYIMAHTDEAEQRSKLLTKIENQVERITRLVDNLLLMTRLDAAVAHPHETIAMTTLLDAFHAEAATCKRSHVIQWQQADVLPQIRGNTDDLFDALSEILDNACRFTPDGGVISITTEATANEVWIEIADSGTGIPADALPHIFETFWRQDDVHSTPGFGLGLSIAKRIITQHGGEITVTSEQGHGTTVRVCLPVLKTAVAND